MLDEVFVFFSIGNYFICLSPLVAIYYFNGNFLVLCTNHVLAEVIENYSSDSTLSLLIYSNLFVVKRYIDRYIERRTEKTIRPPTDNTMS